MSTPETPCLTRPRAPAATPPAATWTPAAPDPATPFAAEAGTGSMLRGDLTAIGIEGAAYSGMVGIGENYFPAFTLAMGLGDLAAGWIATLPMLLGGCLQMVTPAAVVFLRSHRRWVVLCAAVQAACFLPLMSAAYLGSIGLVSLFAIVSLYWAAGLATIPAWNTWVGALVPARLRAQYFARRSRRMQAVVLAGFGGGGILLQAGSTLGMGAILFVALFLVAATCRFISVAFLASQRELETSERSGPEPVPGGSSANIQLLGYFLLVQFSTQIAGPFFTPFMLGQLHFSYATYAALTATALLAKVLTLPLFGFFARQAGARRLLWIGGMGLAPLSSLWMLSHSLWYLFLVQFIGGAAWAAYELAVALLFFDSIPARNRTMVLSRFFCANAAATALGSVLGGGLLSLGGRGPAAYQALFALSSIARCVSLVCLFYSQERGSRESGCGSRESGVGSRESGVGSRESGVGSFA